VSVGYALANKRLKNNKTVFCVLGDGEFNEGSVIESLRFASAFNLPIVFVLDDNEQISLGRNILGFKDYNLLCNSLEINYVEINGSDFSEISKLIDELIAVNKVLTSPIFIRLRTIKGFGVSFMEKNFKWHHRRANQDELNLARKVLRGQK